jgi:hypothetical protein
MKTIKHRSLKSWRANLNELASYYGENWTLFYQPCENRLIGVIMRSGLTYTEPTELGSFNEATNQGVVEMPHPEELVEIAYRARQEKALASLLTSSIIERDQLDEEGKLGGERA